jgi:uncharacterized metal-binding protein
MNLPTTTDMAQNPIDSRPIVYSCSGCSSAAQLANTCALALDRAGLAEMSCIAGVGGGVKGLVRVAQSGRPILALDGCGLRCTVACLANQGVEPTAHVDLSRHGVRKRRHQDPTQEEHALAWSVVEPLARRLSGSDDTTEAGDFARARTAVRRGAASETTPPRPTSLPR